MATAGISLQFKFLDVDANAVNMNYKYADSSVSDSAVQALAAAIINNGSIFQNPPVRVKSAEFVTTQVRSIPFNQ